MSASNRLYKRSQHISHYAPLPWGVFFRENVFRDRVMWIALGLGLASAIFAGQPAAAYPGYIDFKTLACLASLMAASGGLMQAGLFDLAAARIVNLSRDTRQLYAGMIACTFFASMFITNDVALIVFVPMTLLAFRRIGGDPALAVILQTVAANVGSALLPSGNPQNLFLFSRFNMELGAFVRTVLPLSVAGAALLAVFCLFVRRDDLGRVHAGEPRIQAKPALLYALLFAAALLAVLDILDYRLVFAAVVAAMVWKGRILAQHVDYALLLTFIGFFVFVGNVSHVPEVGALLVRLVRPGPFLGAVLSSQVISNVPAAVMLAGFVDDPRPLLAGVSAGGCGTLIASMASLISYKLYVREWKGGKRYLWVFTLVNVLFLLVMVLVWRLTWGRF